MRIVIVTLALWGLVGLGFNWAWDNAPGRGATLAPFAFGYLMGSVVALLAILVAAWLTREFDR